MSEVYLGFDFGLASIGVAVGQSITKTAQPLRAFKAKKGVPDWQSIKALIDEWHPSALIVGMPFNMDGTDQWTTDKAREFADTLAQRYQLPVHEVDERLSTAEAKSALFEQGGYKALEKAKIDSMSAKLILDTWLQECGH